MASNQFFLFHGDDSYSSAEHLKAWIFAFQKKYPDSVLKKIEADEIAADQLLPVIEMAVTSGGLFAETKLIVVKNLFSNSLIEKKSILIKSLLGLIEQITSDIFLIFWQPELINSSSEFLKKFAQMPKTEVKEFPKPKTKRDFDLWLDSALAKRQINLSVQQKEQLAQSFGRDLVRKFYQKIEVPYDLGQMSFVLDNIAAAIKFKPQLADKIDLFVEPVINPIIFDLTDALLTYDRKKSLSALDQLLKDSPPESILATVVWQFRSLLKIFAANELYHSPPEISKQTSLSPYVITKLEPLVKTVSLKDLTIIFRQLIDTSHKMKSGQNSDWILERFVIWLCDYR